MKYTILIAMIVWVAPSLSFGELIITEVMQNPTCASDVYGEFFEIFNDGPDPINIEGYTIKDDGTNYHIIVGPVIIDPGAYFVLGRNSDTSINGGYILDYEYGDGVFLANGADEIEILDPNQTVIARIAYDGGPIWPDPHSASMYFLGGILDYQEGTNWETSTEIFGCGDFGSPGENSEGVVRSANFSWGSIKAHYR